MHDIVRSLSAEGSLEGLVPSPRGRVTKSSVMVKSVTYPMFLDRGKWRVRKRTEHHNVDFSTRMSSLVDAKREAKRIIESDIAKTNRRRNGSVRDLCDDYKAMALSCRDYTAEKNIKTLRRIVQRVHGKDLKAASANVLSSALWSEYARLVQGGSLQYAVPMPCNHYINSDVCSARSIFAKHLIPNYVKLGYKLDWQDIRTFQWLKELEVPKQPESTDLLTKIRELRTTDPHKWRAIGLVRFAGLRPKEARHARRHWLERDQAGNTFVVIMHRHAEFFLAKSDKPRRAIILDQQLADDLWAIQGDDELLAPAPPRPRGPRAQSSARWFEKDLNRWLDPFIKTGTLRLHRLRGYYADEVQQRTADALTIQFAAFRAASRQLGHSNVSTTINHYLSSTASPIPA